MSWGTLELPVWRKMSCLQNSESVRFNKLPVSQLTAPSKYGWHGAVPEQSLQRMWVGTSKSAHHTSQQRLITP